MGLKTTFKKFLPKCCFNRKKKRPISYVDDLSYALDSKVSVSAKSGIALQQLSPPSRTPVSDDHLVDQASNQGPSGRAETSSPNQQLVPDSITEELQSEREERYPEYRRLDAECPRRRMLNFSWHRRGVEEPHRQQTPEIANRSMYRPQPTRAGQCYHENPADNLSSEEVPSSDDDVPLYTLMAPQTKLKLSRSQNHLLSVPRGTDSPLNGHRPGDPTIPPRRRSPLCQPPMHRISESNEGSANEQHLPRTTILDLPNELLIGILQFVDVVELWFFVRFVNLRFRACSQEALIASLLRRTVIIDPSTCDITQQKRLPHDTMPLYQIGPRTYVFRRIDPSNAWAVLTRSSEPVWTRPSPKTRNSRSKEAQLQNERLELEYNLLDGRHGRIQVVAPVMMDSRAACVLWRHIVRYVIAHLLRNYSEAEVERIRKSDSAERRMWVSRKSRKVYRLV